MFYKFLMLQYKYIKVLSKFIIIENIIDMKYEDMNIKMYRY